MARLKEFYNQEVAPAMMKKFGYTNVMQIPKVAKIVINMGVSEAVGNPKALDAAVADLTMISGQKPIVTKAKKSISAFKVREGMSIGTKVTLRSERMYHFMDKLVNVALARVRDFRGISPKAFDGRGNYTLGLKEHIIFPEINYEKVEKILGMDITIVTTATKDEEAKRLLELFGTPFKK